MGIHFPTYPGGPSDGCPNEAEHCTCHGTVHRGRCTRCGKWPERTIRDTFAAQARREARGQRNVVDLDEYRTRRERAVAA